MRRDCRLHIDKRVARPSARVPLAAEYNHNGGFVLGTTYDGLLAEV